MAGSVGIPRRVRIVDNRPMPRPNLTHPDFTYDPEDPEGFRAGMYRLGRLVGAERTGTTLYELPPGELLCPYHYEYGEEEWLLVLEGTPFLRTPEGSEELKPLDVAFFPRGPKGAHQVGNRGLLPRREAVGPAGLGGAALGALEQPGAQPRAHCRLGRSGRRRGVAHELLDRRRDGRRLLGRGRLAHLDARPGGTLLAVAAHTRNLKGQTPSRVVEG